MANCVRCDICGKVETPKQTKYVKLEYTRTLRVFNVDANNCFDDRPVIKKDVCSECYTKLKDFLGGV